MCPPDQSPEHVIIASASQSVFASEKCRHVIRFYTCGPRDLVKRWFAEPCGGEMGDRRVENSRSHAVFLLPGGSGVGPVTLPIMAVRTSNRISPPTGTCLHPLSLKPKMSVGLAEPPSRELRQRTKPCPLPLSFGHV